MLNGCRSLAYPPFKKRLKTSWNRLKNRLNEYGCDEYFRRKMNFLAKIFGKKGKQGNSQTAEPSSASPLPPGAPLMIKSWDEQGRVIEIPREEWRTKVLPYNFRTQWNKPDALASLIHSALTDGFFADCLEAARQLHRIDPQPHRGAILLAATLLQLRKYDEAEKINTASMLKHGEDGLLLANLAKAQHGQGRTGLAEETLWHALELDPNLEFSLSWYGAIHSDRGGEEARIEGLKRVATLPGSWRAQLHIARTYLNSKRLSEALELYHDCLSRVSKPAPSDMLQNISGDLGNAGHLPEILQLVAPHFDAALHGLSVGNNLIKAYLDLGHLEAAHVILERLYQQNRADWKEHLSFWDLEIAKVRILFAQTLLAMKRVRKTVVQEYQEKVRRLQTDKPLSEPAQSVLQRLINEVFLVE